MNYNEILNQYVLMINRIGAGFDTILVYCMKKGGSKERAVDFIVGRLEMCRRKFNDCSFSKSIPEDSDEAEEYIRETAEQIFEYIMNKNDEQ